MEITRCTCGNEPVVFKRYSALLNKEYFGVSCPHCEKSVLFLDSKINAIMTWNNSLRIYRYAELWIN